MVSPRRFTRAEVQQLLASAKRVLRLVACDILLAPTTQERGRLLVITPGRIGTAPQRNRVRRRLKELFRTYHFDRVGYDCAIFVKTSGINESSPVLAEYLRMAFERVGHDVRSISHS